MKRGVWIAISVGIVLILIAVVVILMFVPLGPAISLVNKTSTASPAPAGEQQATVESTATTSESRCETGSLGFMALGESLPPRGTDGIRLVRVDYDSKTINILSLPSELWVGTPGLADQGISSTTLNNVYLQGKNLASGDDRERMEAAVNLFAATLQVNFGYTPEHYFVIKQAAFAEFIDALGGIDVILPVEVDGRAEDKGYFPAGFQHLTGAMALDLVRISAASEWARLDRQELIIQAIYQTLLTPENWVRVPDLVETFHDQIFTDLSVSQMLEVSCILNETGVVVNQLQAGPDLVVVSGSTLLPRVELGAYILQTVGK